MEYSKYSFIIVLLLKHVKYEFNFDPNHADKNIDVTVDGQTFTVPIVNPSYIELTR